MRRLLRCCCAPEEDEEPLRFSHRGKGLSSFDAQEPRIGERSAADIAAEASRAQEWCLQNLDEMEPPSLQEHEASSVSYTHLTLPTICSV